MKLPGWLLVAGVLLALPAFPKEDREHQNTPRIADSLNTLAAKSLITNPALTLSYAEAALSAARQAGYLKGQTEALKNLSKYYLSLNEYSRTLEVYFGLIDVYDSLHDHRNQVTTYTLIANLFLKIKDFDLASKYTSVMVRQARLAGQPGLNGQASIAMAKLYQAKARPDSALFHAYLALYWFQQAGEITSIEWVHRFLGDVMVQKKLFSQARYHYRMALQCLEEKEYVEKSVLLTRMAHICQLESDNRLNLAYNRAALRLREKSGQSFFIASSCLNVGEAYWLLGRKDSARIYLNRSLEIASKINDATLLEAINRQFYDFARAENRLADAIGFFRTSHEYRNKLTREANRSDILILEAKREIRAMERKNEIMKQKTILQDLKISRSRTQIILFEILLILILGLILLVDEMARKNRKRRNELKELNERLSEEIAVRTEAEARLKRSEELHRFLAENTADVISLIDAKLRRIFISPSCEMLYGYTQQEMLRLHSLLDMVHPDFTDRVRSHLADLFQRKTFITFTYKAVRKDGSHFWAETIINPILNSETGEVANLISVVRDVTERMQYEENIAENARQKEYLLREIHNRVKNNFAILISLMNMQRDQAENRELTNSLCDLQLRVRTMSLVHEQLYLTREISTIPFDNYLLHLAQVIAGSFSNNRVSLETKLEPCRVSIEMALPLGLILNELITNAYKYAFPGERTGHIRVELAHVEGHKFSVSICDNGIGLPEGFSLQSTTTMGSQIVGILLEQVEAKLEVTNKEGACFRILFTNPHQT